MKTLYLLLLILVFTSFNSFAQIGLGIKGGAQYSYLIEEYPGTYSMKGIFGYTAGFTTSFQLSKKFTLRPELLFSAKGGRIVDDSSSNKYIFNYIELPILLSYKLSKSDNGMSVTLGGYVARGFSGYSKVKHARTGEIGMGRIIYLYDVNSENVGYFKAHDYLIRPYDFGVVGGLSYIYNRFLFDLSYQITLLNLEPTDEGKPYDGDLKHSVFRLSAAYLIPIRKR